MLLVYLYHLQFVGEIDFVHLKHYVYFSTCHLSRQRDKIVMFLNTFHSYSPIETSSDYKDTNATYQYYVVTNVLTYLKMQTTHLFHLARVLNHTTTSPPRQKKKAEEASKQRKEKYCRVRPPI